VLIVKGDLGHDLVCGQHEAGAPPPSTSGTDSSPSADAHRLAVVDGPRGLVDDLAGAVGALTWSRHPDAAPRLRAWVMRRVPVTRRAMRARRLPHRCTHVLVFNSRGELFVHLRTATKDVYPSHWDVAAGGVLATGETFDQGAARGLREELGVEAALEALFPFHYSDERSVAQAMAYRAVHDGPFRLQPEEIVRGEFVPPEEVSARAARERFCPDGLLVLAEYLRVAKGGRPG